MENKYRLSEMFVEGLKPILCAYNEDVPIIDMIRMVIRFSNHERKGAFLTYKLENSEENATIGLN